MEREIPAEQKKTSTFKRILSWIRHNLPKLIFENKIGVSEIIAISALLISIPAIWLSCNARQVLVRHKLRPALSLKARLQRIPDRNPPRIRIINKGPVDAKNVQIKTHLITYYPDRDYPEMFESSPVSVLEWSVRKITPSGLAGFSITDSTLASLLPEIVETEKHHRILEFHLSYGREVDLKEYSESVFFFLSPEGKWVAEKSSNWDEDALNSFKMQLDKFRKLEEMMEGVIKYKEKVDKQINMSE